MTHCLRHIVANSPVTLEVTMKKTRVFMACYLIVYKKEEVLKKDGNLEKTLFAQAVNLLQAFDIIVDYVAHKGTFVGAPFVASFRTSLENYYTAFKAWQEVDKPVLTTSIIVAIIALTEAWIDLPGDYESDRPLRSKIRDELLRMRSKLTQLKGAEGHRELEERLAALTLPVIDPA